MHDLSESLGTAAVLVAGVAILWTLTKPRKPEPRSLGFVGGAQLCSEPIQIDGAESFVRWSCSLPSGHDGACAPGVVVPSVNGDGLKLHIPRA